MNISSPESARNPVAGRIPIATITTSAANSPLEVRTFCAFAFPFDTIKHCGGLYTHTGFFQFLLRKICHLRVKRVGHDLGSRVDHGYLQPLRHKVLRHLQPDEARAADNSLTAVLLFHIGADAYRVVRGTHTENTGKGDSFDLGNKGNRSGGNDQSVICFCKFLAGFFLQTDGFRSAVDGDRLTACINLRSCQSGIFRRRVDE